MNALHGNERTPSVVVYIDLINEGHCVHMKASDDIIETKLASDDKETVFHF